MHTKSILALLCFAVIAATIPTPGRNEPITEAQMAALKDGGLFRRSNATLPRSSVNVPITDAQMAALTAGGLMGRDNELQARDRVMNCGKDITGEEHIGGAGKWIPVDQFEKTAKEFCDAYSGTDIFIGHETSDAYPITLTNQKRPSQEGHEGRIVFAIFNTNRSPTYQVEPHECYDAMVAPLEAYRYRGHDNGWGDECYGSKNKDYQGGFYKIDRVGAFGSEVRKI